MSRIPREPVTLEDFWGAFWDKPLWSGISRKSITPTYEQLRGHPLNWRQIGSGAYSIVKSRRRAHWRSRHYWRATGPKAIEYRRRQRTADIPVPVTVSRLAGIISLAELVHSASRTRAIRERLLRPCQSVRLNSDSWQRSVTWIHEQLCTGWSTTTVLHGLTDLGYAVKPDRHLARAVIWSGGLPQVGSGKDSKSIDQWLANDTNKFSLVDWGMHLAKEISPTKRAAETLRKVDFVLMNASALGIVRAGANNYPGH